MDVPSALRGFRSGAIFLAAGLALTAAYFAIPRGAVQNDLYDVIAVASSLAILLGVKLNRPDFLLPWLLFAAGNLLFAVAHIIFLIQDLDNAFAGHLQVSKSAFERAQRTFERAAHQVDSIS